MIEVFDYRYISSNKSTQNIRLKVGGLDFLPNRNIIFLKYLIIEVL